MDKTTEKLLNWFISHRAEMIRDLALLVSHPSVQSGPEPGAPFGRACADCLDACVSMYRNEGLAVRCFPEEGYALASLGSGEEEIGIFTHSDVVPVHEAEWTRTSPFVLKEEGELVYGRGVTDNKEAVVGALYLMKALRELQIPLRHRLTVFIGSNEESGMKDVSAYVNRHTPPSISLVPDAGFPVSLGERGILRLDMRGSRPFRDILEIHGGSAYNIVMPDLECRMVRKEELIRQLQAAPEEWLTLTEAENTILLKVRGVAAHGGSPKLGVSALLRLAEKLAGCEALDGEDREQLRMIAEALSDSTGETMEIASKDPVLGELSAANGIVSMQDGIMTFTLDIRYVETITSAEIRSNLERHFAPIGIRSFVHLDSTPFHLSPDSREARMILEIVREATGKEDTTYYYMSGGTYAKHLPNAFATGCHADDPENTPDLPEGHGRAHQADECLSVPGWMKGIAMLGTMACRLDRED